MYCIHFLRKEGVNCHVRIRILKILFLFIVQRRLIDSIIKFLGIAPHAATMFVVLFVSQLNTWINREF